MQQIPSNIRRESIFKQIGFQKSGRVNSKNISPKINLQELNMEDSKGKIILELLEGNLEQGKEK